MKGLKNNTLTGLLQWFTGSISHKYEEKESKAITNVVFEHFFGLNQIDLIVKKDLRFNESQIVNLYRIIKKLNQDIPLQHITGKSHFRSLELLVNNHVLIPRPETEELVGRIVESIQGLPENSEYTIWDIGTGSGAIAISLAKELPQTKVWGSDISENALEVATRNGERAGVNINFFKHDILGGEIPLKEMNIIVSNPPYVRESEKEKMKANVLEYEPHLALFVSDNDPLLFYRAIAKVAIEALKPGGFLFAEINEALGKQTVELLNSLGFQKTELRKDIFEKDRFVKAQKPL